MLLLAFLSGVTLLLEGMEINITSEDRFDSGVTLLQKGF